MFKRLLKKDTDKVILTYILNLVLLLEKMGKCLFECHSDDAISDNLSYFHFILQLKIFV